MRILKALIIISLLVFCNHEGLQAQTQKVDDLDVYQFAEKMPQYMHGEQAFFDTLMRTVRYPALALDQGVMGTAYVKFVVDTDGTLRNYDILQGVSYECNVEAIRAIHTTSGDWVPGEQNGIKVPVFMTIPVKFLIKELDSIKDLD